MFPEETRRRSRWMIRALEWDDPRARYPNLWHEGMPRHLLVFDTVASRLRLGDLIAVYHPQSQRYLKRSERFLGISRVTGLKRADEAASAWVDLETVHRFEIPLDLHEAPRRVFLSCDPEWPARDRALFQRVFDAAVAAGWQPAPEEREEAAPRPHPVMQEREPAPRAEGAEPEATVAIALDAPAEPLAHAAPERIAAYQPQPGSRLFGGADYSGDMRDPRDGTWLALLELHGERLRLVRLEATGRAGLEARLRNPDAALLRAEAVGLDFPFGLPLAFAESILGGPYPEEGWWALAKKFEKLSRPEYLIALQAFRDEHGELKRLTDERTGAFSPLHRVHPDLGPMTFHGIRMIAEERSRYALKPFESAKGRLLLEVYPGAAGRHLAIEPAAPGERGSAILAALEKADRLPVEMDPASHGRCQSNRNALDAVIAARCAAAAVLSGEAEKTPEELAPDHGEQVRREGWIYGIAE